MRAGTSGVFWLGLMACSSPEDSVSANDAAEPIVERWPRADVERDLVLTLDRSTEEPFEYNRDPRFTVTLENRSTERAYPVVLPSDGSESNWREPHVWYTVAELRDGHFRTAESRDYGRICGLYDETWADEVRELAPGEQIALPWFEFHHFWNLRDAERVRITAHYAYGDHAKNLRTVPPVLHRMPAFAIRSATVELPVASPLALELRLIGPLPRTPREAVAPAFEIVAVNRSQAVLPYQSLERGSDLRFELESEQGRIEMSTLERGSRDDVEGFVDTGEYPAEDTSSPESMAPGERRLLLTPSTITDVTWQLPAGLRRIRAILNVFVKRPDGDYDSRQAKSNWVAVD